MFFTAFFSHLFKDGFVSGFWWLDQLGMSATDGHSAMCRQCLVGGNYSLIDQNNGHTPNPDYWSAWLHKQLMGTTMLAIDQVMPPVCNLCRVDCRCLDMGQPRGVPRGLVLADRALRVRCDRTADDQLGDDPPTCTHSHPYPPIHPHPHPHPPTHLHTYTHSLAYPLTLHYTHSLTLHSPMHARSRSCR